MQDRPGSVSKGPLALEPICIQGRPTGLESGRDEVAADPTRLARRIGPIVAVKAERKVGVLLFGELQPMSFDANAAGAPLLALVPGWTDEHVAALLAERAARPFADPADLRARLSRRGVPAGALTPL